jgi:glycine betaine/proline transport system substrate-binding protein
MKKLQKLAIAFVLSALAGTSAAVESDDPIKLALNEWTGQHITTYIAGEALKRMGYTVEYITAGYYPQMQALTDNSITATLEIWSSNIGDNWQKALDTGKVEELGDLGLTPRESWMYPAYMEEQCPGLPSWEALNDCAEVFATADTFPKGRFLDYPVEWGTTNVDRIKALAMNFDSQPAGSEGAILAELKRATAKQEPLVLMFWSPHWYHALQEMKIVELPDYEPGCHDDPAWGINPDATYDCDWDDSAHIDKMGWIGLKDKWPGAHKLLTRYTLDNTTQETLMHAVDVEGNDALKVVNAWLDENEATWKPWTM